MIHTVKLQINYNNFRKPNVVMFSISCQAQYVDETEIRLEVKLNDNTGKTVNRTISECSKEIQFGSLHYSTTYKVEIFWKLENLTICHIENDANIFYTGRDSNTAYAYYITFFVVIFFVVVIAVSLISVKCHNSSYCNFSMTQINL